MGYINGMPFAKSPLSISGQRDIRFTQDIALQQ